MSFNVISKKGKTEFSDLYGNPINQTFWELDCKDRQSLCMANRGLRKLCDQVHKISCAQEWCMKRLNAIPSLEMEIDAGYFLGVFRDLVNENMSVELELKQKGFTRAMCNFFLNLQNVFTDQCRRYKIYSHCLLLLKWIQDLEPTSQTANALRHQLNSIPIEDKINMHKALFSTMKVDIDELSLASSDEVNDWHDSCYIWISSTMEGGKSYPPMLTEYFNDYKKHINKKLEPFLSAQNISI